MKTHKRNRPPWKDTMSGFAGAVCGTTVGIPFEVVKVRMQTSSAFSSPLQTVIQAVRKEGALALWKGLTPALMIGSCESTVLFTVRGLLKNQFPGDSGIMKDMAIGGISGFFSATATCPGEVIKCRLQVDKSPGSEQGRVLRMVKTVWKENRLNGFFKGLPAIWCRDVPFFVTFFGSYESYMKHVAGRKSMNDSVSPFHYILGGGLAGSFGWSISYPFDVVKSRLQSTAALNKPTFVFIKEIARNEGFGMFRGYFPCVIRGFPVNGALLLGVEISRAILD